jgi:hypothetical protein
MFSRNTVFVWIGIILLSGMFLMGQDGWTPAGERIVFVSSTLVTGAMLGNGLEDADQICKDEALSAELPNAESYKAWLSDSDSSPDTRFLEKRGGPFRRPDKVVIAQDWADLTDGQLSNPINRFADGTIVPNNGVENGLVWTNTLANGKACNQYAEPDVDSCDNWYSEVDSYTGWVGDAHAYSDGTWSKTHLWMCDHEFRLYCFEQI